MMVATTATPPNIHGVGPATPPIASDDIVAAHNIVTKIDAAVNTTEEEEEEDDAFTAVNLAPSTSELDKPSTAVVTTDVGNLTAGTDDAVATSNSQPAELTTISTVAPPINRRRATSADGATDSAVQRGATVGSRGGGGVRPIPPFGRPSSTSTNSASTSWAGRGKKLFSMILDSPRRAVRRGVGNVRRQQSEDSLVGHLPFSGNVRTVSNDGPSNVINGGRYTASSSPSTPSMSQNPRPRALQGLLQRRDENVTQDIQRRAVRVPSHAPPVGTDGRIMVTRAASAYGLLESRHTSCGATRNIANAAAAAAASCSHDIGCEDSDEEMLDDEDRVESAPPLQTPSFGLKTRGLEDEAYYARMSRKNVLQWLRDDAPSDILPKILSFAGARKLALVSRLSKSFRSLVMTEPVWRTLCEDTGKWVVPPPVPEGGMKAEVAAAALTPRVSWKQYYRDCPLVPVDYSSLEAAFAAVSEPSKNAPLTRLHPDVSGPGSPVPRQRRNVRILLRPGTYAIKECLVVQAVGAASVTIETVNAHSTDDGHFGEGWNCSDSSSSSSSASPYESYYDYDELLDYATPTSPARRITRRLTKTSLRGMLTCRSNSAMSAEDNHPMMAASRARRGGAAAGTATASMPNLPHVDGRTGRTMEAPDSTHSSSSSSLGLSFKGKPCMGTRRGRAVIILKTKRQNEPIVRVTQGALRLSRVDLVHNALGTDIWNGNSAIQVQPPFDTEDNPIRAVPPSLPPTAVLAHVDVTSLSGRGIVNIDGGYITVRNSYIHHCAATGLYVGGPGSVATIERTDVVRNGGGNERSRRGIARGHSGVYLEQGVATLRDCNISHNTLTGISAVSQDNATLSVEDSDLVANGSIQLEMPPDGSASRRRSVSRDNTISNSGTGRSRSGLLTGGGGLLHTMHSFSSQGTLSATTPLTRSMSTGVPNNMTNVAVAAGVPIRRDEVERLIRRGGASVSFRGFPTNGGLVLPRNDRTGHRNITRSVSVGAPGARTNIHAGIPAATADQADADLDEELLSVTHPPEIVPTAANSASAAAASRAAASRRSALRRAASWR